MKNKIAQLNFPFLAEVSEHPEHPEHKENALEVKEVEEIKNKDGEVKEYIFTLEKVPGAEQEVVEVSEDEDEKPEEEVKPKDEWDWESGGLSKFLDWLQDRFKNIPKHSGYQTTGLERAIAYFRKIDSEISRAMSKDFRREIDVANAEKARDEIKNGLKRLNERLKRLSNKEKKDASFINSIVKNAETSTTGRIIVTVPYFISNIARTCIEATVQGGRDIEDVFSKLEKEYKLDKREKSQIIQLVKDMGYPMLLDRVNPSKDIEPSSTEVSEYVTQYYS